MYKFGTTQLEFKSKEERRVLDIIKRIPVEWLAAGGVETNTHMTIRYGWTELNTDVLLLKMGETYPRIEIAVEGVDTFPENKDGVPLFYKVKWTPELQALYEYVSKFGSFEESKWGDYKPHITIAYIKPEYVEDAKKLVESFGVPSNFNPERFVARGTGIGDIFEVVLRGQWDPIKRMIRDKLREVMS